MADSSETIKLLDGLTAEQKAEIFQHLRKTHEIHPFERRVKASAEIILEAMGRASAFTIRGIEGVIAEAAFAMEVLPSLSGWKDVKPPGDFPYDFLLEDQTAANVRVQVKMQRRQSGVPMTSTQAFRWFCPGMWVVETQKSRKGEKAGKSTRPYRFGEFDILAVSMCASRSRWSEFMYTVSDWLLPGEHSDEILKFQPIPQASNSDWTDDFAACVGWFNAKIQKRIAGDCGPRAGRGGHRPNADPGAVRERPTPPFTPPASSVYNLFDE